MHRILLILAVLSLSFAPAPLPKPDKKAESLDGKVAYESQTIGGWEVPKEVRDTIWIEIRSGSFYRGGPSLRQESRITLDPSQEPKGFVLEFTHPTTGKTSRSLGIYR